MKILQADERGKVQQPSVQVKWKLIRTVRKRLYGLHQVVEWGDHVQGKFLFFSLTQLIGLEVYIH